MTPPSHPNCSSTASRVASVLLLAGVACAVLLAVPDLASSRMLVWPWQIAYWAGPLALAAALAVRGLCGHDRPVWSVAWRVVLAGGAAGIVLSTAASPVRGQILPWAAWPLAGLCLLAVAGPLLADPVTGGRRRALTFNVLGATGALLAVVSLGLLLARVAPDFGLVAAIRNPHPLGHVNYTAGTGLLFLPVLVCLAWNARGLVRAGWSVAVALDLAMMLSGGSRGALAGLAAAVLTGAVFVWRVRLVPRVWVVVAGVAVLALGLSQPGVRRGLLPPPPDAPINMSNAQRTAWIEGGWELVQERPLSGWGAGATPWVFPRARGDVDHGPYTVLQLHQTPLQIWLEGGLMTLAAAVLLAWLTARAGWRIWKVAGPATRHDRDVVLKWGAITALAGYGVFSLTDYQLDLPVVVVSLALLLAVAGCGECRDKRATRASRALQVLGGLALALAVAWTGWIQLRLRSALEGDDWREALMIAPGDAALRAFAASRLYWPENGPPVDDASARTEALGLLEANTGGRLIPELSNAMAGWIYLETDPARARAAFVGAVAVAPNHHSALLGLALAAQRQGDRSAAVAALVRATVARPRFWSSGWWRTAELATMRGDVLAGVRAALSQVVSNTEVRPSIRRDAGLTWAMVDWVEGSPEAAIALRESGGVFWRRLLDAPEIGQPAETPTGILGLVFSSDRDAWTEALPAGLRTVAATGRERSIVADQPDTAALVRSALNPSAGADWPYYQRLSTRSGFPVIHRHPRLDRVHDGLVHIDNLWCDFVLTSLWPEEFWLPDSLLKQAAPLRGSAE